MVENVPTQAAALESSSTPPSPPASPALGKHTARGFAWMLAQTVLTKGSGLAGQIIAAHFLVPHDFHLISLVYIVICVPALIKDAGLQTILVQRQRHLRRWIGPVFWMSLVLAIVSSAIMLACGPIGARVFNEPILVPLVTVWAIGGLLNSLSTVPTALAQIHLRFRFQAMVGLGSAVLLQAVLVILAWRGFGPYSYMIAFAVCYGAQTAAYWVAFPFKITLSMQLRRWRFLLPDSGTLLLVSLLTLLVQQGDNFFLGLFHKNDDALGIFFFAFNLSWQSIIVLTTNLGSVLYPAMMKLQQDLPRQLAAYLRAARALSLLAAPACFLQAAVAVPAFHLFFKPAYYPAIPVMQALCVGMAFRCVGITAPAINMARARYRLQLAISAVYALVFLATMAVAAKYGAALSVGIAEGGFYVLLDPIMLGLILKLNGGKPVRELWRIFAIPLGLGAAAAAAGWCAAQAVPQFHAANLVRIAVNTVVAGGLYFPLIRVLAPKDWSELRNLRKSA